MDGQQIFLTSMATAEEQESLIATLQEVSNQDEDTCRALLEAHLWNLPAALESQLSPTPASPIRNRMRGTSSRNTTSGSSSDGSSPQDSDDENRINEFHEQYKREYGCGPPFGGTLLSCSYRLAVQEAYRSGKFLFTYLHGPDHDNTNRFCTNTLNTMDTSVFFQSQRANVVSWMGTIRSLESYSLGNQLGVSTFPFMCLLVCVGNSKVKVAVKIEGPVSSEVLVRQVAIAMESHASTLETARVQHVNRVEENLLRQEQDREYEESLEADRRREAELANAEAEAAAAEAARVDAVNAAKEALVMKRQALSDNVVTTSNTTEKVSTIRLQLHNGTKLTRKFFASDTLGFVRDFVDVSLADAALEMSRYELATNYPRRVWGPEERDVTLESAGLTPQALLYVQDLDS